MTVTDKPVGSAPALAALLRALLADPAKLDALTPEREQVLVSVLQAVVEAVKEHVVAADVPPRPPSAAPEASALTSSVDDLLTVSEAAAMLRVSPRWLYRQAKNLPFARKLSRKVLRFSRSGLAKWLANKRL